MQNSRQVEYLDEYMSYFPHSEVCMCVGGVCRGGGGGILFSHSDPLAMYPFTLLQHSRQVKNMYLDLTSPH